MPIVPKSSETPEPVAVTRPELDGLRLIAVLAQILFAMGLARVPGGLLSADVFLVVSGFLITTSILGDLKNDTFWFSDFWERRLRRMWPGLLLVVMVLMLSYTLYLSNCDRPMYGGGVVSSLLGVSNIYYWWQGVGPEGFKAQLEPFLHTWVISLILQCTLLVSLVLVGVTRRRPTWLIPTLAGLTVVSFMLFLFGIFFRPMATATFHLLPMRLWEFTLGGLLVPWLGRPWRAATGTVLAGVLGLLGLGLVVAAFALSKGFTVWALAAVAGAVLVVAFGQQGPAAWLLKNPLAQWLGKLSYPMYLWHWIMVCLLVAPGALSKLLGNQRVQEIQSVVSQLLNSPPWQRNAQLLALLLLLSGFTFLVSSQVMTLVQFALPWLGALTGVGLLWGITLLTLPDTYDTTLFGDPTTSISFYDTSPKPKPTLTSRDVRLRAGYTFREREIPADLYRTGGWLTGNTVEGFPEVVVLGDSQALMWCNEIQKVTDRLGMRAAFWAMSDVSPYLKLPLAAGWERMDQHQNVKLSYDAARYKLIQKWQPKVIFLAVAWDGTTRAQAEPLVKFLSQNAKSVFLFEQPPRLEQVNYSPLQYMAYKDVVPREDAQNLMPRVQVPPPTQARNLVRELGKEFSNCGLIGAFSLYTVGNQVRVLDGKSVVYLDSSHLTDAGATLVSSTLDDILTKSKNSDQTPKGNPSTKRP